MGSQSRHNGKRIAQLYFIRDPDVNQSWICRCEKRRKVSGTGYSNILHHVKEKHPVEYHAAVAGATVQ